MRGVPDERTPGPPPPSPTIALLVIAGQVERALEAALQHLGLNRRKLGVLGHLARSPGISFTELAQRASVTVQSMHVIVRGLESDGLVVSGAGQRGRPATITLTDAGRARLAAGMAAIAETDRAQFDDRQPVRRALADAALAVARQEGGVA